jgi:hypothetical protein
MPAIITDTSGHNAFFTGIYPVRTGTIPPERGSARRRNRAAWRA